MKRFTSTPPRSTSWPAEPATIQLWPEHFDAGTNLVLANGERVNLGFSPGDATCDEPYAYVGPWSSARGGDPAFWNASFGAVLRRSELDPSGPRHDCARFLLAGMANAAAT